MTTAHRPTFDPARGKEALRGPGFHQRLLPAYTKLKYRQPGQLPSDASNEPVDMHAELLAAEAAYFAKTGRGPRRGNKVLASPEDDNDNESVQASLKRAGAGTEEGDNEDGEDDVEVKRRKVLEATRDVDADSEDDDDDDEEDDDDDDSDSDDSDDSEAELQRELELVRKEKAEKKAREEAERKKEEEEARMKEAISGNPLLNKADFTTKRRWNDDVVFKNQARGTEDKKKEFVNDMLRSDFHRRFMSKYVR